MWYLVQYLETIIFVRPWQLVYVNSNIDAKVAEAQQVVPPSAWGRLCLLLLLVVLNSSSHTR